MKIKKMLLGALAVLALAAFAVPASASATTLYQEGQPITEEVTLGLEGSFGYAYSWDQATNYQCHVQAEATFSPNGEAQLSAFNLDSCQGSGMLSGCELASYTTNAAVSTDGNSLNLSPFELADSWAEGCYFPADVHTGEVNLLTDNGWAISSAQLGGSLGSLNGFGSADVFGEVEVSPAGAYGIEG